MTQSREVSAFTRSRAQSRAWKLRYWKTTTGIKYQVFVDDIPGTVAEGWVTIPPDPAGLDWAALRLLHGTMRAAGTEPRVKR